MKQNYDFSEGRRGRVVAELLSEPGQVRISIRLDEDLLEYLGELADRSGGKASYKSLLNATLRDYLTSA
jgi:hypothetical protein